MADQAGQAEIRGMQVDKVIKAYETELSIFKKYVQVVPTGAREIRWYQETAGILTATSPAVGNNVSPLAQPFVIQQSVTRNTSYIRKFMFETPLISEEDIKDSDVSILLLNLRSVVKKVEYDVDARIWDILTESRTVVNINTNATTAAWDAGSGQDIIEDLEEAKQNIRTTTYEDVDGGVLFLSPKDYKSMVTWLISSKGASIPNFSSEKIATGSVTEILGLKVVVSNNVTADYALVAVPKKACEWKSFMGISQAEIIEPGIGRKYRVWEEGEAILVRPKFCNLITNTQT